MRALRYARYAGRLDQQVADSLTARQRARACRRCQRLNGGRLLFEALLARAGVASLNARVYSKARRYRRSVRLSSPPDLACTNQAVLERELCDFVTRARRGDAALGCFGHLPPESAHFGGTPAPLASHRVVTSSLHWVGDALFGVLEVLPTPAGEALVHTFVLGACALGVSTRGWLQTDAQCASDFQLIACVRAAALRGAAWRLCAEPVLLCCTRFDVVVAPATIGAQLRPLDSAHAEPP